jgi:hypothetical protein
MKISRIRSKLYKGARTLGDIQSLQSPEKFVKRQIRKRTYRRGAGWLSFLLHKIGV